MINVDLAPDGKFGFVEFRESHRTHFFPLVKQPHSAHSPHAHSFISLGDEEICSIALTRHRCRVVAALQIAIEIDAAQCVPRRPRVRLVRLVVGVKPLEVQVQVARQNLHAARDEDEQDADFQHQNDVASANDDIFGAPSPERPKQD